MTTSHITLTDQQQAVLHAMAQQMGKTEDELVQEVVEYLIRQFQSRSVQQPDETSLAQPDLLTALALVAKSTPRKQRPRQGWDTQFKAMAAKGDDRLPDWGQHTLTTWDEDEWEW